ncbi:ribosome small subunit-dependent GTPase A [Halobacillus kuroshimensis]|uniref:Small ribosomal subunit biogenesis GTPase RsgA n=1 Tax=Halobacillus kuroshimensis TaxID=302481 RepID=A0ABS3DS68_9BACI|nr:ribosome small subunit-dependent GTPase A [Halobacillus kuroshimensis]MBN8234184.1 ribosome small subunit-dependent GTPase A [Halobacillus kuroshimensis]
MKRKDFTTYFKEQLQDGEKAGRVTTSTHGIYTVADDETERFGEVSGRFHYHTVEDSGFPAVGDWVVIEPYDEGRRVKIQRVLNRNTVFSRSAPGQSNKEQVIAANVDVVFVVTALTQEMNPRRLERYIEQVYESGARPVIVCTKKDLSTSLHKQLFQIEQAAPGVPVYPVNSLHGEGLELLKHELTPGQTVSLVGSSGVGKSTLMNALLEKEVQETQAVREEDDRGRHTTTHRELFSLPDGSYMMDTPGMRELQLWGNGEGNLDYTFSDIGALSAGCRFRDCRHEEEPGCAVQAAIQSGEMEVSRLKSYNKLKRERRRLELKDKYGTHRTNRMLHGPNAVKE